MQVFLVTTKGIAVPCTIKNNVIRPTVKGGYRILCLENKRRLECNMIFVKWQKLKRDIKIN